MNRKRSQFNPPHGIAACSIAVTVANEIQLFPAGNFRATDGRPHDVPHWFIDAILAAQIIAEFEARAQVIGDTSNRGQTTVLIKFC